VIIEGSIKKLSDNVLMNKYKYRHFVLKSNGKLSYSKVKHNGKGAGD